MFTVEQIEGGITVYVLHILELIENLEVNSYIISHLILEKDTHTPKYKGQRATCPANGAGKTGCSQGENYLSPCTKIKPKWIKGRNVRLESLKLLGENVGSILRYCISLVSWGGLQKHSKQKQKLTNGVTTS